jgi:23S rRNA (adenine2503-C2)-methyltransferase
VQKNLFGLTHPELREFILSLGEPGYRANQLFDWLYSKGASSFDEMSSFSKSLRARLGASATIDHIHLVDAQRSSRDGTTKLLFELSDGKRIESVLIPSEPADDDERGVPKRRRVTLCVSTQVGCPLDCAFCATATMGFERNLTVGEIVDQVFQAQRIAVERPPTSNLSQSNITNLVYMGMGEPLMNYENVMASAEIITPGLGIAPRRITISTAGWADRIKRMANEHRKMKLAVSLHSLDDDVRERLMPVNKKFPVDELVDAIEYYYRKIRRRVTYEYILFDGVNDSEEDLRRLVNLSRRIPSKVNVVPFHSIDFAAPRGWGASLKPTPSEKAERFVEALRAAHVTVMVRSNAGEDIDAACGQLAILSRELREVEYA